MSNKFKYFIYIITLLLVSAMGDKLPSDKKPNNYIHIHKSEPQFSFEVPNFKNWRLEVKSSTYLRFHPSDSIPVDFEEPPKILIFLEDKFNNIKFSASDIYKTNPSKVHYKKIRITGFELDGLLFEKENKKSVVTLPDYNDHGLDKNLTEKILIDTFKFL